MKYIYVKHTDFSVTTTLILSWGFNLVSDLIMDHVALSYFFESVNSKATNKTNKTNKTMKQKQDYFDKVNIQIKVKDMYEWEN